MLNFKKIFIVFLITFLLFSSSVLATSATKEDWIYDDLFVSKTGTYRLTNILLGNAFISSDEFIISPEDGGGSVEGDLFITSKNVQILKSGNATTGDTTGFEDKATGCTILGNAYIIAETLVIESNSEIQGDLYVIAQKVEIQEGALIQGNIFVIAEDITMNGQVKGSAYLMGEKCYMDYSGFIYKDLHLEVNNAELSSYIYRNAYINADTLTTNSKFSVQNNLEINANKTTFAGQIIGNVKINSKNLEFNTSETCTIFGNLDYSTNSEITVSESIVIGEIAKSEYVDANTKSVLSIICEKLLNLVVLLVYVFAICLIIKFFIPKCMENLSEYNIKKALLSIGVGILSIIASFLITIFLWMSVIGTLLGFVVLFVYIFLLAIALPVLIYVLATILEEKLNWYAWIAILTTGLYTISLLPFVGGIISFLAVMSGTGIIIINFFKRK